MKKGLEIAASGVALLLVWQIAACVVRKEVVIPAPANTLPLAARLFVSESVLRSIWQTSWKVVAAIALSMPVSLGVGFALGRSGFLYRFFRPWILVIQAVPVISWLTLVIFAWGIGWKGPVLISTLSLLPTALLTTISGVRNLDLGLLEMARFYRVPRRRLIKDIYLGSLFPFIAAILDVNVGQAWKVVLVSEYLCGGDGLGEQILMARMNVDTPKTWALTLIAVGLGIVTEILSKRILRRAYKHGTVPHHQRAFEIL